MSDVGLVCFDWGGVILRICRSWREGCAAAGLDVRPGSDTPERIERRRAIARTFQNGDLSSDDFIAALSNSTDGLYSQSEMGQIHESWLLGEYEGVDAIVAMLNASDRVETALLSNTNELHWHRHSSDQSGSPAEFPTAGLLTHKIASHLQRVSKPSPEIYHAMSELTGFSGSAVLFFDDLIENIEAARAVGWRAEQIDHTGDTAAQIKLHLHTHEVL